MTNSASIISERISQLGWTYVPKSRTAFVTIEGCGRVYLRTADRRDYSRRQVSLRFATTAHLLDLMQAGRDLSAAAVNAEAVAEILLEAYEGGAK